MESNKSSIKITCLANTTPESFQPPATLDVSGHKLVLTEMGRAIGYDKDQKVWFRFERSGSIEIAEVAEKAFAHLKTKAKPCTFPTCPNHILPDDETCWGLHREPSIERQIEATEYKPNGLAPANKN